MYTEPWYWSNGSGMVSLGIDSEKFLVVNFCLRLSAADWDNAGYAERKFRRSIQFFTTTVQKIFTGTGRCRNSELDSTEVICNLLPSYSVDYSRYE